MQLRTCCRCCSLKTGTIFSGVCGIVSKQSFLCFCNSYARDSITTQICFAQVLAVISLILIFTANVEWKTIIIDILDKTAVKIIFAINLCMTILISTLLIIGALRVRKYFHRIYTTIKYWKIIKNHRRNLKISNCKHKVTKYLKFLNRNVFIKDVCRFFRKSIINEN